MTVADLAKHTNLSPSSIRRVLSRMQILGMAATDGEGAWAVVPFDPDLVAAVQGTLGKGARAQARRARESEARAEAVALWAKRHPRSSTQQRGR